MDHPADASGLLEASYVGSQKDRVVTEEEWLEKWEVGNIGFHKEEGHPYVTSLFCLSCFKYCHEMTGLAHSRNS